MNICCRALGMVAWLVPVAIAIGQPPHTTVSVPQHVVSNGFYERFGTQWGFQGRGFFFQNGGPGPVPVFGGYDPSGDARFHIGGNHGFLNLYASTGSSRSMVSNSAMLTMPQAGIGSIYSSALRPFVIGYTPVVYDGSASPLAERLERLRRGESASLVRRVPPSHSADGKSQDDSSPASKLNGSATFSTIASSASRSDISIAEIRRQLADDQNAKNEEALSLCEQARVQAELGKPGVARVYYQRAAKHADGKLLAEIQAKLQELETRRTSTR
ncbi:MAG: hypothetical protein RIS70_3450 [Planctomycetota bacterium]